MAKFRVDKSVGLTIEYEYDIQPGDVFLNPMKGWEVHVKSVLDSENVLAWYEYSSNQKALPLAERTDVQVAKVRDLVGYYWGPLRGGEYKMNDKGAHETIGATWVAPRFPISAEVHVGRYWEPYEAKNSEHKPDLVCLAPLAELIHELVKPWIRR